ncbi:universal stress protein [Halobacteria archaeon AArc-curdl1]|uniref:Universal stress protein n=1 Tax=Natronosalvus hydrolyticus TaxID=2979988 RepID=A0AAP2Z6Q3_9EURY|nr:universal stress protein [Halobacteria archaeon AArc-curdl1]
MYETILIPTDGSEGTDPAIVNGLDIARTYDATLHALYVIDIAELLEIGYLGADSADFEETIEPLEDEAKRTVEAIEERARREGVDIVTVVRQGTPYEEILEYTEDAAADLIVMGTHGRSGLSRYLIGSVTERIVRTSDVPVLVVQLSEDGE